MEFTLALLVTIAGFFMSIFVPILFAYEMILANILFVTEEIDILLKLF